MTVSLSIYIYTYIYMFLFTDFVFYYATFCYHWVIRTRVFHMFNKLVPFPLICYYICKRFPTLQVISVDYVPFCAGFGLIHGYQWLYGMKLLLRPKLWWFFLCQILGFFLCVGASWLIHLSILSCFQLMSKCCGDLQVNGPIGSYILMLGPQLLELFWNV